MNNDYLNYQKCVDDLTAVLSIGYFFKYSTFVIEKRIAESKYFNNFNKKFFSSDSYITTEDIVKSIYFDAEIDDSISGITYKELEWVAVFYIHVIEETNLGFEAIFCYASIKKAMELFHLYHELDFSKAVEWFNGERRKTSIIKIVMKQLGISNTYVSEKTHISLSMIDALKNRRRDIRKLDLERSLLLVSTLNITVNTLLSN